MWDKLSYIIFSWFKLLGVEVKDNSKWNSHVTSIVKKANKRIYYVRACRRAGLPSEVGLTTYHTKICPLLEHASPIRGGIPRYLVTEIERGQERCLRIIGLPKDTLRTLARRRDTQAIKELERLKESNNFVHLFPEWSKYNYNLRNKRNNLMTSKTNRHKNSFIPRTLKLLS